MAKRPSTNTPTAPEHLASKFTEGNHLMKRIYYFIKIAAALTLLFGTVTGISSCTSMEGDSTSSSSPREGS